MNAEELEDKLCKRYNRKSIDDVRDHFNDFSVNDIIDLHVTIFEKEKEYSLSNQSKVRQILNRRVEYLTEQLKEAYTDGFNDSRFDFDIETYTQ